MSAIYQNPEMSPQKSMVRGIAYGIVPPKDFYGKKHGVIAGRHCRDIHHLFDLGVTPYSIIACDTDVIARAAARKLGVIMSPYNSIEDTVPWMYSKYGKNGIATQNIDLCNNLITGLPILNKVLALGVPNKMRIFFTFHRGHDPFNNSFERLSYLKEHIKTDLPYQNQIHNYQSYTKSSKGSSMCMIII